MSDLSCILIGAVMTCSPLTSNVPTTTIFMQNRTITDAPINTYDAELRAGYNRECRGKIDPLFVDFCRSMRK